MAIPKAFQGSVDYNNGSTQAFRGTFNEPGMPTTTTATAKTKRTRKPKTTATLTTTTTTTQPNAAKKTRKTKKTNKANKPKRAATNWTTFTQRVSTIMKSAKRTGGPNAVMLASTLKKENPNVNVKNITNDQIKTRMATFTAPEIAKKGTKKTTTTTTTVEPEEELQRIIFKKKKYYYDEKTGATYNRNNSTNAKGKYVGVFTPKNSATGKPKLNTNAPEPGRTVLPTIENLAETEEETNNNRSNSNNNNNGNITNTENESTNNETNQGGGSYNPSCGCDLQANWPPASVLPRGGIQGGGGCGCMKWGGKRSSLRKRSRKQSGGGCPTPDACPFPGTGYCGFYARGGYKATKKNRNAL